MDKDPSSTNRLRRNVATGMDPTFLQTAFVGADNKRIKHRVHRGALHLPSDILDGYDPPEKEHELPAVGSVTRPSLDDSRKIVVAQVRYEERLEDVVVDSLVQKRPVSRILITNEFLKRPEAKRIRGGGDEPSGVPGSSAATPMEIDEVSSTTTSNEQPKTTTALSAIPPKITTGLKESNDCAPSRAEESKKSEDTTSNPSNTTTATTLPPTGSKAILGKAVSTDPVLSKDTSQHAQEKQPPVVSSSNADGKPDSKLEAPKQKDPKVVPLSSTPKSQWELRKPTKDEIPLEKPESSSKPGWYQVDEVSEFEKVVLPEWFDQSSKHRTPESYIQAREKILFIAKELGTNRFLTGTMVRRAIAGDAGSLLRLHDFLSSNGLINENAINDTQPTLKLLHKGTTASTRENVIKAVVQQVRSKQQSGAPKDDLDINWDSVSSVVGDGMTAATCKETFKAMTTFSAGGGENLAEINSSLKDLLAKCNPSVLQAATLAAFNKSDDTSEVRIAASAASIMQNVNSEAESHETQLAHIMGQTLDIRMKRLESRLAMVEEVEAQSKLRGFRGNQLIGLCTLFSWNNHQISGGKTMSVFTRAADLAHRGAVLGLLSVFGFQLWQIGKNTIGSGKVDSPYTKSTYFRDVDEKVREEYKKSDNINDSKARDWYQSDDTKSFEQQQIRPNITRPEFKKQLEESNGK